MKRHMGGKNSWGRECIHISQLHTKRDLDKWKHLLRMTKEERMIFKLIHRTICNCEDEHLHPRGATLGFDAMMVSYWRGFELF
jgi:hypothetical protein